MAQLLNIDAQILINCITRIDANDTIEIDNCTELDAISATHLRNLLCRTLYGRLFTWVIHRINDSLKVIKLKI